jgi:flagellar motor switch/type III secretory pathway protein FliN
MIHDHEISAVDMSKSGRPTLSVRDRLMQLEDRVAHQYLVDRLAASAPFVTQILVSRASVESRTQDTQSVGDLTWNWKSRGASLSKQELPESCIVFNLSHDELWFELRVFDAVLLDELNVRCVAAGSTNGTGPALEPINEIDASQLPPELHAQFRTAQIQPLTNLLGHQFSTNFVVSSVYVDAAPEPNRETISFAIDIAYVNGATTTMHGSVTPLNTSSVARLEAIIVGREYSASRRIWAASWPLALTWQFGVVDVAVRELQNLARGDVILIDRDAFGWATYLCSDSAEADDPSPLGCGYISITNAEKTSSCLDDAAMLPHANAIHWRSAFHGEKLMSDLAQSEPPSSLDLGIDGLSVQLRFTLPAQNVSFSRLNTLAEGSILPFEQMIESSCVTVMCGKKVVGTGVIVAVGDYLGVQLTTIVRDLMPRETVRGASVLTVSPSGGAASPEAGVARAEPQSSTESTSVI